MGFGKYINSKFDSSTMDLNVSDFIQISKDEFTEQQTQPFLNSWTWNGAFPWVYNHETESWFYYSFAGNTCNAYDARDGIWYSFNNKTGLWENLTNN